MVMNAIDEALQEKHIEACDARLQLQLNEKKVKQERYKFLASGCGAVTAMLGVIGTVVAYQASGC
jgi:NifU-like protein involved in Fe-S cluster formation